jgi:hypothetical protein
VIRVDITEDQRQRASGLYDFGALKDSITKGKSNIYGALGEVIVHDHLESTGRKVKFANTADYDLIVNGRKVDVKSKRTTVPPLQSFNCSISAHNTTQKCDFYVFARVNENKKEAWICGWIPKDEFFKTAKFYRKGQADPKFPSWKFAASCYNLEISKLTPLKVEK